MATLREKALYFESLLRMRLVQPNVVIAWLDSEILASAIPDTALIDAALTPPDRAKLREILCRIDGPGDPAKGERMALAYLRRLMQKGVIDQEEAWRCIDRLAQSFFLPVEEMLILQSESEDIGGDLLGYLGQYADFESELPNTSLEPTA